jgi:YD repeat-containing protein
LGSAQYQNGTGSTKEETYYKYNSAGEETQTKQLHVVGGTNTWLLTSFTYGKFGNVLTKTDALNRETFNQYSSTYLNAYLTQTSILVSGQNYSTTFVYNFTLGFESSTTNPRGYTTYYSYDNIGRLISVTFPQVGSVIAVQKYSYNDLLDYYAATDPRGNATRYYYDGIGRLTQVALYNGSSLYATENFTYTWRNDPASFTTATSHTYQYFYDLLGRLYKTTNPDSSV